jgi:D-aminopeptidase
MIHQKRIADYGIPIGDLPRGPRNKLSDVAGVQVGHCTLSDGAIQTGVTVILPSIANPFTHKLAAGCCVLNGFGKTSGLVQVEELGTIETPIALTNTLSVGAVQDALVETMIEKCRGEGVEVGSINAVVGECNDGYLNDIQARVISKAHVRAALADAREDFAEGSVGAGAGMSCFGLKGGIGSASRVVQLDETSFTVGVLALANFGALPDLTIAGRRVGRELEKHIDVRARLDQGSVIVVLATDAPLSDRQIGRVGKRAVMGLARLGSQLGHGSGDIVIGFSTANVFAMQARRDVLEMRVVREDRLDGLFRAMAEATEEAVLNAMVTAQRMVGKDDRVRESLGDWLEMLGGWA